jgi:hypothetical protein
MLRLEQVKAIIESGLEGFVANDKAYTIFDSSISYFIDTIDGCSLLYIDKKYKTVEIAHFNGNISEYSGIISAFVSYFLSIGYALKCVSFYELQKEYASLCENSDEAENDNTDSPKLTDEQIDELLKSL